jgi:predicted AAA+ superfamily ATPase
MSKDVRRIPSADIMSATPPVVQLREDLLRDVRRDNPWWSGLPSIVLPPVRRNFVAYIKTRLQQRLASIVVVRGPRQVGKTTAQFQVIADLLDAGVPPTHIMRVQCDDLPAMAKLAEPILRLVEWYEAVILKKTLNEAARAGERTYLFFDEVQNLPNWAVQLKHLVDGSTTQVIVTGSSALRIEQGRDSLAGRITSIEVGTDTHAQ